MKLLMMICSGLLLSASVFAQPACNDEVILNTKGSWKKQSDANVFPELSFPRSQFPQIISRIDKVQKLLQAAYPDPKGMEAGWYRGITGKAEVAAGPVPYQLSSLFLAYYCNTYENKIERGGETGTWLYVWANQLNNWFATFIEYYIIQKQPVYLLPKRIGKLSGYPLYEGNYNQTSNTGTRYSRAIILTRAGQSPYVPVTQKQFLKAFINYNEKRFAKKLSALAEKWIADAKRDFEMDMKPARALLADSLSGRLEQPALLDYDNLLMFKEFISEDEGGRQLVRLNPGYFDISLPRYMPQLFIVHWSWNVAKPSNYWREQVEKNFNFNALKEMIDK